MFCGLFYVHILFYMLATVTGNKHQETKNDARLRFADLLKDIVGINERRFEAMKQLARLQEYTVTKYQLRSGRDYYNGDGYTSPLIVVFYRGPSTVRSNYGGRKQYFRVNTKVEPYKSLPPTEDLVMLESSSSEEEDTNSSSNEYDDGLTITRKSWNSGCGKKIAKYCTKACRNAFANSCMMYDCSRRQKRSLKKECKRACRSSFSGSDYSDYDY